MAYTRKDNSTPVPSPAKPAIPQVRSRFAGLSSSAVALFRVGTYRARMAAALLIVAGSLLYQTGAEAMQESSKKVLYLDAPSVSVPQAEKAGETARGYAGPDSNVDDAVLAWVDAKPVPLEARKAFASITDPSGQPPGGVSYDDAVAAGDAMVAQLGGDSPAPPDGEDDELASVDPVRPKLGDGTKAAGTSESDDEDQRPNIGSEPESAAPESGSQDPRYAAPDNPAPSDLGLPAPMAEEYAPEPSMDSPATPPAEQPPDSSGDELAAVPEDGSEGTEEGAGGNSETGPISDGYAPDTATPDPSGDDPSDGSADEAEPQDEKEPGSPDAGPDPQEDETFPKIVVSDSPTPDEPEQAPEQEYAAVPEGSGTDPETSETPEPETETSNPADTVTPQDEPSDEISSDLSSEPSPSSTGEESVPTQDTSPGTDEQDPEILPDLVAVVPYDSGAEESQGEGQEGLEQSSQPPAAPTAEPSSGPSTDEADSYSPEPGRQEAVPEQATATSMSEEQQTEGEDTALQPEAGPSAELGSGEDTEDTGTEEELPEGVQVESSDESGAQKLSVVVHQESEAADTPANNSSDAQDTPEPTPSTPTESEQSSPAPQEGGDRPSAGPGESTNPEQPDDAPGRSPGDQQQPAPQTSPEPGPAAHNQDRRGDQRTDEERVTGQEPGTSTPNPAPAPKDQRPRQSGEEASQVRNPTQNKDSGEEKQQPPQPEQQQPAQLAREPHQSTAPAKASPATPSPVERGEDNGVQGPTQSAEAVQISAQPEPRTEPQAESIPAQDSQPPTPTAATNTPQSNEAVPAPQNQPMVTAELVIQPPAASQAEPETAPEAAPEAAPAVQTPVEPATEEVADPAGWADPTQAARQTTRQVNQAMDQAADQISVQPANAATQSYAAPAAEQVWDQVVQPEAGGVQGQWTADTDVSDQAYPVQDAGMQASGMVESVNQANQVDSYTQEALGSISEITTPPENIADPYADPYVEPSTESSTVPAETSYEAPAVPAVQDVTGAVEDATQDGYLQNAADPYVEDATVDAAPASQPVPEHVAYGGAVDSTSYEDLAALPETYAAPTPTETYAEPVTQVPVQQLEPVQQVPTQQLDPAPQAADVLDSGPTVAQPSPDPTNSASGATSPAPAQQAHQQVASTVNTAIQQTIGAEGTTGGGK